jgi:hypothetical protein
MPGLLLVLLSSIATCAADEPADSMAAIARDFVRVALLFQNHDTTAYLFIGPEALRTEARGQSVPLPDVVARLLALRARIDVLPAPQTQDDQRRRRDLAQRITALVTRGGILMGNFPASFDEEVRLVFGVQVPVYDEAHFRAIAARLDSIIPGDGDLVARVEAFREQFVIPPDRLEAVIGRAMAECRAKTRAHIALPEDEQVTLNITSGKHWVGFTEYRGSGHSIVHLNRDVPVHIERAIELGCHEGYPGHHVHATLVEQELVKRRGWAEYSLINLLGPMSVIAEGAANFGVDLAFSRDERTTSSARYSCPWRGSTAGNWTPTTISSICSTNSTTLATRSPASTCTKACRGTRPFSGSWNSASRPGRRRRSAWISSTRNALTSSTTTTASNWSATTCRAGHARVPRMRGRLSTKC